MTEIRHLQKPDRIRLTLPDDSIVELTADQIKEFSQNMGDVRLRHERCGDNLFLGPLFCPDCKAKGSIDHCGKYFVYQTIRGELELIEFQLKDGRTLYAKDYERVKNEEDIKRTMEERAEYHIPDSPFRLSDLKTLSDAVFPDKEHTFTVTLPNSDQRQVKAAYMKVDGATLYFEDEDHETILAFGPGHWVWAERVEENEPNA